MNPDEEAQGIQRHAVPGIVGSGPALVIGLLALGTLAALAVAVAQGWADGLDRALLRLLHRSDASAAQSAPSFLEDIARDVTSLGSLAILSLALAAASGFLLLRNQLLSMLYLLTVAGGGALIAGAAKDLFDRSRPALLEHADFAHTASFPSGHSMMAAVVFVTIGALISDTLSERRLRIYVMASAVILTMLVGISRVYLGVHWPTDVVAGWLAGTVWACVGLFCAGALSRTRRRQFGPWVASLGKRD